MTRVMYLYGISAKSTLYPTTQHLQMRDQSKHRVCDCCPKTLSRPCPSQLHPPASLEQPKRPESYIYEITQTNPILAKKGGGGFSRIILTDFKFLYRNLVGPVRAHAQKERRCRIIRIRIRVRAFYRRSTMSSYQGE